MKKTIILLCICVFFVLTACSDSGGKVESEYLKGNLKFSRFYSSILATKNDEERAKSNSPYLLYLDGKGKFETIMKDSSSNILRGKYEIEIYPKELWDRQYSGELLEEGLITLSFNEKVYGSEQYEYFIYKDNNSIEAVLYYGQGVYKLSYCPGVSYEIH